MTSMDWEEMMIAGQMSAWYLFSVMGFYPVCPGTDQYVLGAPYSPYVKLKLPNGKTLEIKRTVSATRNVMCSRETEWRVL